MEIKIKIGKRDKKVTRLTHCLKCGLELPKKGSARKFCDEKCRTRYYSLKGYNSYKDDPKYKLKRKKYHAVWRKKNHQRFNELMRKASKKYQHSPQGKKKAEERKAEEKKKRMENKK